jgi:hypothetical protein
MNSRKFLTPTKRFSPQPFLPVSSACYPKLVSQDVGAIVLLLTFIPYEPAFQYGTFTLIWP